MSETVRRSPAGIMFILWWLDLPRDSLGGFGLEAWTHVIVLRDPQILNNDITPPSAIWPSSDRYGEEARRLGKLQVSNILRRIGNTNSSRSKRRQLFWPSCHGATTATRVHSGSLRRPVVGEGRCQRYAQFEQSRNTVLTICQAFYILFSSTDSFPLCDLGPTMSLT